MSLLKTKSKEDVKDVVDQLEDRNISRTVFSEDAKSSLRINYSQCLSAKNILYSFTTKAKRTKKNCHDIEIDSRQLYQTALLQGTFCDKLALYKVSTPAFNKFPDFHENIYLNVILMGGSLSNFQDKRLVTMIKNILGSFADLMKRNILRFNPGVAAVDQLSKKIILVAVTHLLFLQLKNKSYTRNRCLTHQPSLPTKIEIVWQRMTL